MKTTLLPFTVDGEHLPVRQDPPKLGAHTKELLAGIGIGAERIDQLLRDGVAA